MKIYRRMKLTGKEIDELTELLDGYIWVAMDAKTRSYCGRRRIHVRSP